jgi:hypothetical protein
MSQDRWRSPKKKSSAEGSAELSLRLRPKLIVHGTPVALTAALLVLLAGLALLLALALSALLALPALAALLLAGALTALALTALALSALALLHALARLATIRIFITHGNFLGSCVVCPRGVKTGTFGNRS